MHRCCLGSSNWLHDLLGARLFHNLIDQCLFSFGFSVAPQGRKISWTDVGEDARIAIHACTTTAVVVDTRVNERAMLAFSVNSTKSETAPFMCSLVDVEIADQEMFWHVG